MTNAVEISGLNKWFKNFHVLKDINLTVAQGERVVVCGPSGSGKSTLIRCINGLESFEAGRIEVCEVPLQAQAGDLSAVRRQVGMVFQRSTCSRT